MLTLDVLRNIRLSSDPTVVRALAAIVAANYKFPWTKTTVRVDGAQRIPWQRSVIFAMNHTDRFNYLPFFRWSLDHDKPALCTWTKGKYYQHPVLRGLLASANQIPVPSRGYAIAADALDVLGRAPAESTYQLIRDFIDRADTDLQALCRRARRLAVGRQVARLVETPRQMLGYDFDPIRHNYLAAQLELFRQMIDAFVELNVEAFRLGCNVLVFPEGTRSSRLGEGRTGLAQVALRLNAPIVPVGCNGSLEAYPGNVPLSGGGQVVYRVGRPLLPGRQLADFQIEAPYHPFTSAAWRAYGAQFGAVTDLVMDRINGLLDARYRRDHPGQIDAPGGTDRFI